MKQLIKAIALCTTTILTPIFLTEGTPHYQPQAVETASEFCEGWEIGYPQGYCYQEVNCFPPPTPLCPLPQMGMDKFEDGRNRGFLRGLSDKNAR